MNIIQVNSLPLKEVLQDIANVFKTSMSNHCEEYMVNIPSAWGEGYIRGINFKGGLGLIEYSCTFKEDLEIQFVVGKVHPLKYLFCLEGILHHRFANLDHEHTLEQFQNSMVASKSNTGHIIKFQKETFIDIYSLEVNRKKFKAKMHCDINQSRPKIADLFRDDTAKVTFYYKGLYSLLLSLLFQEIKEFDYNGLTRKIFLEGKAYQILANQLIQYDDDEKNEDNQNVIRKSEVKSILEAIAIIEDELDDLGSVQSIAQRVGLNGNKIQNGFKSLYGLTVNGYIQQARLDIAKKLLVNTNIPIQEIMEKVGWNSKSYFSKIFKDTHQQTPSEFRKKNSKYVTI